MIARTSFEGQAGRDIVKRNHLDSKIRFISAERTSRQLTGSLHLSGNVRNLPDICYNISPLKTNESSFEGDDNNFAFLNSKNDGANV